MSLLKCKSNYIISLSQCFQWQPISFSVKPWLKYPSQPFHDNPFLSLYKAILKTSLTSVILWSYSLYFPLSYPTLVTLAPSLSCIMPSTLPPQGLAKAVPLSDMLFLQIPALFTVFPPLALCSSTTFSVRPLCPYFQFNNIPSGISLPLLFYFLCNYHHVTYYLLHLLILFFICSSSFMHWRRTWQPTPVFLLGESQERRSLVGCCLWGCTESDTTEVT